MSAEEKKEPDGGSAGQSKLASKLTRPKIIVALLGVLGVVAVAIIQTKPWQAVAERRTLSGVVYDAKHPTVLLSGVEVIVKEPTGVPGDHTEANGRFKLTVLQNTTDVKLIFRRDGYEDLEQGYKLAAVIADIPIGLVPVRVPPPPPVKPPRPVTDVPLIRHGRVRAIKDGPIAGAEVAIDAAAPVVTGANGEFTFRARARQETVHVNVVAPGYQTHSGAHQLGDQLLDIIIAPVQ